MSPTTRQAAAVALVALACASDGGPAPLGGRVVRHGGVAVAGARVEIGGRTTTTAADGTFSLDGVAPGVYLARVVVGDERPHAAPVTVGLGPGETLVVIPDPPEAGVIDLWIGGDVMFSRRMEDPDQDGVIGDGLIVPGAEADGAAAAFEFLAPLLEDADLAVVNLETTVTDRGHIHPRKPYTLRSRPGVLAGMRSVGVDVVGLGNNHVYDYLDEGVARMIELIDAVGLARVGAGRDWAEAVDPLVIERNGVKVAFVAATSVTGRPVDDDATSVDSPPYYTADPPEETGGLPKAGTLRLDRANVEFGIQRAQALGADLIVLLVHGGTQYADRESDYIRLVARHAIDLGAHLVVGHHPHVIQGVEMYRGVPIVYSVGNLVFDQQFVETFPALVVEARGRRGVGFERVALRPIWLEDFRPRAVGLAEAWAILRRVASLSAPMGTVVRIDAAAGVGLLVPPAGPLATRQSTVRAELRAMGAGAGAGARSAPVAVGEPGWFLASVAASGARVDLGRDLLFGGTFDDGGADDEPARPLGWDVVGREKEAGRGVLALERSSASALPSTARSTGRVKVAPGERLTLLGRWRADADAGTAIARIAFYDTREHGADPIGVAEARGGAGQWRPFEVSVLVPEAARYAEVHLVHLPPTRGDRGRVEFDEVALVAWGTTDLALARWVAFEADAPGAVDATVTLADRPAPGGAP